ncbi:hypothetical protein PCANC_06040 [Puccinia coronata f. sp. avenae]|uniref:Uncharacterized protein n=1 Tax=Puccinia coronata f. sp. avenae TaxID=200324 RepID=A0A2N5T536_9BASI|nr:hypothetical protein PCANC_06040 [Puccinia coronata f. sp. avenae]
MHALKWRYPILDANADTEGFPCQRAHTGQPGPPVQRLHPRRLFSLLQTPPSGSASTWPNPPTAMGLITALTRGTRSPVAISFTTELDYE